MVSWLLGTGVTFVGARETREYVPIISKAIDLNNLDIVSLMVTHGIDLSVFTRRAYSFLHQAASVGNNGMIRLMVQHVEIDDPDIYLFTPLKWAITANKLDSAQLLIDLGANAKARDSRGQTLMQWAGHYSRVRGDDDRYIALLARAGADTSELALPFNGTSFHPPSIVQEKAHFERHGLEIIEVEYEADGRHSFVFHDTP